jgi:hypothetical protein
MLFEVPFYAFCGYWVKFRPRCQNLGRKETPKHMNECVSRGRSVGLVSVQRVRGFEKKRGRCSNPLRTIVKFAE